MEKVPSSFRMMSGMDFVNDVLMGKAPEKLTSYFDGNRYIQHNPAIANGLDGLGAALKWMAENNMVMVYDKLHLTLAEGDKVLCVSEGKFGAAPGEHVTFYDIFRLENGKIVEHWDNIQTIPTDGQWANPNGKFGF